MNAQASIQRIGEKASVFAFLAILLVGCSNRQVKTYYADSKQLKSAFDIDADGHKQGFGREYYDTGELKALERYERDQLDSTATYYWKNGKPRKTVAYANGAKHGASFWYFENGKTQEEQTFLLGEQDGWSRRYYENGQLEVESLFGKGIENGMHREWYATGKPKKESKFWLGEPDGPITEWHENGKTKLEGHYDRAQKVGVWQEFNEDGQLLLRVAYENNSPVATFTAYGDGKKVVECGLQGGKLHGTMIKYNPTGKVITTIRWENGKAEGGYTDMSWLPSGVSMKAEELIY